MKWVFPKDLQSVLWVSGTHTVKLLQCKSFNYRVLWDTQTMERYDKHSSQGYNCWEWWPISVEQEYILWAGEWHFLSITAESRVKITLLNKKTNICPNGNKTTFISFGFSYGEAIRKVNSTFLIISTDWSVKDLQWDVLSWRCHFPNIN